MHCSLEIHLERKKFQYLKNFTLSLTRIMSITDVQLEGQGGGLPCLVFKIKKKCLDFRKKGPDCVQPYVKFTI